MQFSYALMPLSGSRPFGVPCRGSNSSHILRLCERVPALTNKRSGVQFKDLQKSFKLNMIKVNTQITESMAQEINSEIKFFLHFMTCIHLTVDNEIQLLQLPVLKTKITDIRRIIKRRFLLRHVVSFKSLVSILVIS